jgi:hypothetical protein
VQHGVQMVDGKHRLARFFSRRQSEANQRSQRKAIVEQPFGTIKWSMDQGHFLMKGIPKTSTDISMAGLRFKNMSYNIALTSRRIAKLFSQAISLFADRHDRSPGLPQGFLYFVVLSVIVVGKCLSPQLRPLMLGYSAAFYTAWRFVMRPRLFRADFCSSLQGRRTVPFFIFTTCSNVTLKPAASKNA